MEEKREKMQTVRISNNLYNSIKLLNKLQIEQGNKYTLSDTINILLQASKKQIEILSSQSKLF